MYIPRFHIQKESYSKIKSMLRHLSNYENTQAITHRHESVNAHSSIPKTEIFTKMAYCICNLFPIKCI